MKASVFHGTGDIRIDTVPDPKIEQPTDAIVRLTHTAICGSDLWFYRGQQPYEPGSRTGHDVPRSPLLYDAGLVIVAQSCKTGYLGGRRFVYDAGLLPRARGARGLRV